MTRPGAALLLAALLAGAGGQAAEREITWPDYQPRLLPGSSESMVRARLPDGLEIAAADPGLPETKTDYLGLWEGWMCNGKSFDIKLAVVQVGPESAEIVYAGASLDMAPHVERVTARFVARALIAELKDFRRLTLELRPDGHLNVKGEAMLHRYRWCVGIMNRMW